MITCFEILHVMKDTTNYLKTWKVETEDHLTSTTDGRINLIVDHQHTVVCLIFNVVMSCSFQCYMKRSFNQSAHTSLIVWSDCFVGVELDIKHCKMSHRHAFQFI